MKGYKAFISEGNVIGGVISKLRTEKEEASADEARAESSEDVVLLTEIRDLLKYGTR